MIANEYKPKKTHHSLTLYDVNRIYSALVIILVLPNDDDKPRLLLIIVSGALSPTVLSDVGDAALPVLYLIVAGFLDESYIPTIFGRSVTFSVMWSPGANSSITNFDDPSSLRLLTNTKLYLIVNECIHEIITN